MLRNAGLDATADEYGVVVVCPDGIDRGWAADGDDVASLEALIDRLDAYLVLDLDRGYARGSSAGGVMGHWLARSLTDRLAGMAPVAATPPFDLAAGTMRVWTTRDRCDPSPTVSVAFTDPTCGVVTRREAYPGCTQGVEVELHAMEGAGHSWPTASFPVNDTIAAFLLRRHR